MIGRITDIQRFSIHDGPGIRTTAFLKGCTLHCPWCHNPETVRSEPEVLHYPERCIGCGRCVAICPHFSLDDDGHHYERTDCPRCREAARGCPSGALQFTGRTVRPEELAAELLRDRLFFDESGGGVTISGGEPLAQAEFTIRTLEILRSESVHICLDTAADGDGAAVERLLPLVDIFLVDCKETRPDPHLALTGRPLEAVCANLRLMAERGAKIHLRCPIVPGVNDDPEHLAGIGRLADSLAGIREVHLLPFHRTGAAKWAALGRSFRYAALDPPAADLVARWADAVGRTTDKPIVTPPRERSAR